MISKFMNQKLLLTLLFLASFLGIAKVSSAIEYCRPGAGVMGSSYYITAVKTTGGVDNISATAGKSDYFDFTKTQKVSASRGGTFNLSITTTGNTFYKVWIDWNQDGYFHPTDDLMYSYFVGSGASSVSTNITIPAAAKFGNTRMRISADYYYFVSSADFMQPCMGEFYGSIHDYTVVVNGGSTDCGKITLKAGSVSGKTVCPGTGFELAVTGETVALDVKYQWQKKYSAESVWKNIASATTIGYAEPEGVEYDTDYRLIVTCLSNSRSDTSSAGTVKVSSASCPSKPCTPSSIYGYYYYYVHSGVSTKGAVTDFTPTDPGAVYTDLTATKVAEVNKGMTFDLKIDRFSTYATCQAWIDWNQNNVFEPSEVVAIYPYSTTTSATFKVKVPYSAKYGKAKMRVRSYYYYYAPHSEPCGTHYYSKTEDYTINVLSPRTLCEDVTLTAGKVSTGSVCRSTKFTVDNVGSPTDALFERIWQSRPAGTTTWTTIVGADGPSYDCPGITSDTEFRCITSCAKSGQADTSSVGKWTLKAVADCYCTPIKPSYTTSYYITKVVTTDGLIDNIDNTSTYTSTGYSDFTSKTVGALPGSSFTLSVDFNGGGVGYIIWIDYNQSGTFDTDEIVARYTTTDGPYPSFTSMKKEITVPRTAISGKTRMRIMSSMWSGMAPNPIDPCKATYYYGDVEDYTVNILNDEKCDDLSKLVAGTLSDLSICESIKFTIFPKDGTISSSADNIWQYRKSGTTTWSTYVGKTDPFLVLEDGVTENVEIRKIIYCSGSGKSDTSNVAKITLKNFADCYCTPPKPTYPSSYYTTSVETTDALVNFVNTSTYASTGYQDFTKTKSVSALQGTTFNLIVKNSNTGYSYGAVWIDYNQNGKFESTEKAWAFEGPYSTSIPTYYMTVNVPADAKTGKTRMRISTEYYYYAALPLDPCKSSYYGEVEDYEINIIKNSPCEEIDMVAGKLKDFKYCPLVPFTITNEGTMLSTYVTRTWQSRPAGTTTWTTISGATGMNYTSTAGIAEDTEFRCILYCAKSGKSDTTNVAKGVQDIPDNCYCEPGTTRYTTMYINKVETEGGVSNISNPSGTYNVRIGYSKFLDKVVSAYPGDTIFFNFTSGYTYGSQYGKVYVDWNYNGVFDAGELVYINEDYPGAASWSGEFVVPYSAKIAKTRIRFMLSYMYDYGVSDPCASAEVNYGETEDYTFQVLEPKSCDEVSIPTAIGITSNPLSICKSTGDIDLTVKEPIKASNLTYEWYKSDKADGTYTLIRAKSSAFDYTDKAVSKTTYYILKVYCKGELVSTSLPYEVKIVNPTTPEAIDGNHCGPGNVVLTADKTDGTLFWYDTKVGGDLLGVGDTFVTPKLESDSIFYVSAGSGEEIEYQIHSDKYSWTYTPMIFSAYYRYNRAQVLYNVHELKDYGLKPGKYYQIKFKMTGNPKAVLKNYKIKYAKTTKTDLTSYVTGTFTEIFSVADFDLKSTETGWVTFNLSSPIDWDGTSGLIFEFCQNNSDVYTTTGSLGTTMKYNRVVYYGTTGSYTGDICTNTTSYTSSYVPSIKFVNTNCNTERVPVKAYVRPSPEVEILLEDGTYCTFNDEFTFGTWPEKRDKHTYEWFDGSTDTFITVNNSFGEAKKYWVGVTNEYGCTTYDTVTAVMNPSPTVELGNDTLICLDGSLVLDAGNPGDKYYWSTGEKTQTIETDKPGMHTVVVTNKYGCIGTDTINIKHEGHFPKIDAIKVTAMTPSTFKFTPLYPEYVVTGGYLWDFGDGKGTKTDKEPTWTYEKPGTYDVTLTLRSSCGYSTYYTYASIATGIDNNNLVSKYLKVYPNPANTFITVEMLLGSRMTEVSLVNALGQVVLKEKVDNLDKVTLDANRLPSGVYQLTIQSTEGFMVQKVVIEK